MRRLLLLLVLAGCSSSGDGGAPAPSPVPVRALCGLSDLPRTSASDLTALRDRAVELLQRTKAARTQPGDVQIVQAATVLSVQAELAAKLASAPQGLQSSLSGIAGSLEDAETALRDACG